MINTNKYQLIYEEIEECTFFKNKSYVWYARRIKLSIMAYFVTGISLFIIVVLNEIDFIVVYARIYFIQACEINECQLLYNPFCYI